MRLWNVGDFPPRDRPPGPYGDGGRLPRLKSLKKSRPRSNMLDEPSDEIPHLPFSIVSGCSIGVVSGLGIYQRTLSSSGVDH